jgi:hypothetical protein
MNSLFKVYIDGGKPILKFYLNILFCYQDIQDFVILWFFLIVHVSSLLQVGPFCTVHGLGSKTSWILSFTFIYFNSV